MLFDGLAYIASYSDLIVALGADEAAGDWHYLHYGAAEGRARNIFDAEQYLFNYADLRAAFGWDPRAATVHWIQYGYFEGRTVPVRPSRSRVRQATSTDSPILLAMMT